VEKPMPAFDARIVPARADLAAKHLEGKVAAARYAEGVRCEVIEPQTPLRLEPRHDAPFATEALKGERVTVYETTGEGWAWGQLAADKYVGWLSANALVPAGAPPTHKVTALRTFVFTKPSIKEPPLEALPFEARLAVARFEDRLAVTWSGTYVPAVHLAPIDVNATDFVAVAERFLGAPYLWGGKTMLGLDCSGLVQIALSACGRACPRDTDMQEAALGEPVPPPADISDLQRGDLLFWKGHVAIVRGRGSLLHANAFAMAVAIEPIADAVARSRDAGNEVTGVRRIGQ
jgi:cell wall-associated NlpC family hydrolase